MTGTPTLAPGYAVAFGAAAVACVASVARARRVDDPDTRRGLVGLLLTSGGWAAAHALFFVVPGAALKTAVYTAGLVVGFATVGPWLYFCSAYAGRSLHRNPAVRRGAVALFVAVTAVKLTNPLHGLYFTTEAVATPVPHLAVHSGTLHWVAMGLAYALAAVGYFVLFELFVRVGHGTRPLLGLVGLTAVPVVLDVVGAATPILVDVTYEPLGVAAFAVGVCFVYLGRFRTVQVAGDPDDPTVVLSDGGRVRDFDAAAAALFPALDREAVGRPLRSVLPTLAERSGGEDGLLELDRGEESRFYRVTTRSLGGEGGGPGRLVVLSDVTDRERYRRELERQNERLDRFARTVSHDLRNSITVADSRLEAAREGDGDDAADHLATVAGALDRMETLVEEVLALAREGRTVDDTEVVRLSELADRCWELVETDEARLVVEDDLRFLADPDRTRRLLENLFRNAVEHGSTGSRTGSGDAVEHGSRGGRPEAGDAGDSETTDEQGEAAPERRPGPTVRVGTLDDGTGFFVADDGSGIPPADRESVFESGYTTAEDGTGFGLAIVAEIAAAHGWDVAVVESDAGGARFECRGVAAA
jgi:signal transduction histidine kinase